MYVNRRLFRTKFLPLFVQRRFLAHPQKVWGHGTILRSDGLCKIQCSVWRKPGAVWTLRSASFKHKNNALGLYGQQPKTNFGRLNNYIGFYLWKRKIPPTQRSDGFCRVKQAAKWIGCVAGRWILSWAFPHGSGGSHGDNQPLPVAVFKMNTTTSCGWFWTNPQN